MKLWPHAFELRMNVTVAAELEMTLEVRNVSREPMQFEDAMHTYFAVGDVQRTSIEGLDNVEFLDKVDASQRKTQPPEPIQITGETDRVYFNTEAPIIIRDPVLSRSIKMEKQHSKSTVVWNPWVAKARAMPDFGDAEWPQMLCIETANAMENTIRLEAGAVHRLHTRISVST
jgi:D-hexose-6-phosphate mutarotase